jgi:chemotaxis signal transduction protein
LLALVFPLGPERYALPIQEVREIVATPALTTLPTAPAAVLGLVNLRGDILPVFDASRLVASPFPAEPDFVMVVDTERGTAGVAASGLPSIVDLEPALESDRALWSGSMHAIDGEPVVMLDVTALLKRALAES